VYDVLDSSAFIARRSFRFRGNFVQPESRDEHGERRIRLWVPWLRTPEDALAFVREFFRAYAQPTSRFLVETDGRSSLIRPWEGRVRLEDRDGAELITGHVESVRVAFDHVPRFRLELGPDDPRTHWPEPPEDERWELPETQRAGGLVTLTEPPTSEPVSSDGSSSSLSSDDSAGSTGSSGLSSGESSETCPCSPETEFTFTLSGVAGGMGGLAPCGHFNRAWTLTSAGGCAWGETHIVGGTGSYTAGILPLEGILRFSATPLGEGSTDCAEYTAEEVNCAGETEFSLLSSPQCTGWPGTVTVAGG
jgi:hypothetical protein